MSDSPREAPERVFVLWIPNWSVHSHRRERRDSDEPIDLQAPLALVAARRIVACSDSARAQGVRPGLREREALSHCPELLIISHDPAIDERHFAPVLAAIEEVAPGVDQLRPGLCALRGRGPARYYGGETSAAEAILGAAAQLGFDEARMGIADGLFAAQQAARASDAHPAVIRTTPRVHIIDQGLSADFLSPLPIERACDEQFAALLRGLGIHTLGAFAALPETSVRQRFGAAGIAAHRRSRGLSASQGLSATPGSEVQPQHPQRDFAAELDLEPPIDASEQLAFACARLAEHFVENLVKEQLVCTALRVEMVDDIEVRHERVWAHPQHFTAADVVNRIRWQADAQARMVDRGGAGITHVRISPERTESAAAHEPALWNTEPDERVHHRFTQVQSRLGHTGIGTFELDGGRSPAERQRFVPWGVQRGGNRTAGPWPGALPEPHPSVVFTDPPPAEVLNASGKLVTVDADDLLSAPPASARIEGFGARPVEGWSAPWPLREHWWRGQPSRFRMQLQLSDGSAWLLRLEQGHWSAEGRYD